MFENGTEAPRLLRSSSRYETLLIKKILTEASTEHYDESVHDFGPHQLEEQFLQGRAEQATKRGCQIRHTGLSSL